MSSLRKLRFYTLQEYYSLVKESEERYEYWNGEIFLMSGASPEHVFITDNILNSLATQLRGRNCRAMSSEIRLKVPSSPPFRYADISVGCGELIFEDIDGLRALVNPVLLVEVLSSSTERFDRQKKFDFYKSIESFREYLLVAQDQASIVQYVKREDGSWQGNEVIGLGSEIYLPSINCRLLLREVYQDVLS
jgi:Uma2 family endonuclease